MSDNLFCHRPHSRPSDVLDSRSPRHKTNRFWRIPYYSYRISHTILLMNNFSVSESSLRLKNPSEKNVAFKIKTTAPQRYLFDMTWLDLIWPFRYCVRPNASTVPPNGEAIIKVMLQPGGTDERHKFMVQSIYGKFWPSLTSNDPVQKLFDDSYPDFTQASAGRRRPSRPRTSRSSSWVSSSGESSLSQISSHTP